MTIAAAEAALAAGDRDGAIAELLAVWRETRAPAVADALDRLTTGTAITAATIAARTAVWLELAERRDPTALGALLATPWPGRLQLARPLLRALLAWPDDPRIAMALARIAGDERYVMLSASPFFRPLCKRLIALRDARVVPVLRAQLAAPHDRAYDRVIRPLVESAVTALAGLAPPALEPVGILAPAITRGADELVAAILAAPDDLALRTVYGDALSEAGDPRGELIALSLAGAAPARVRALIREHGAAWAGSLGAWFDDHSFEAGMFSGGTLRAQREPDVARMLADPGWALIRTLDAGGSWSSSELAMALLARVPSVRVLRGLDAEHARTLASGPVHPLVELSIACHAAADLDAFASLPGLPLLRRLGLSAREIAPAWLATAPVLERIERLVLRTVDLEPLGARAGALREVEVVQRDEREILLHGGRRLERELGWHLVLRRDAAPGQFVALRAHYIAGAPRRHFATDLAGMLDAIPAHWLRELEIVVERMPVLSRREHEALAAAVARFTGLERATVPWAKATAPAPYEPPGLRLALAVEAARPSELRALWTLLVDELGQRYDTFSVNDSAILKQLGDQPLERARTWAEKPGTTRLRLSRDGGFAQLEIVWSGTTRRTTAQLALGKRTIEEVIAWFVRCVSALGGRSARLGLGLRASEARAFDLGEFRGAVEPAWLIAFGGAHVPLLPFDEVAAIDGIFAIRAPEHVVIGFAPEPAEISARELAAVSRRLRAIMLRELVRRLGYDLHARALALLGPAAAALGLAAAFDPDAPLSARFTDATRQLAVSIDNAVEAPVARVALYQTRERSTYSHALVADYQQPAATAAQLDAVLATAAARAIAEGPAWFDRS